MLDYILNANMLVDYALVLIGVYIVISSFILFFQEKNGARASIEVNQEQNTVSKSASRALMMSILLSVPLFIIAYIDIFSNKESVQSILYNIVIIAVAISFVFYAKKRWA